jgi:hypothetical protein
VSRALDTLFGDDSFRQAYRALRTHSMPDISPWLENSLPSPPTGSREDLALRLHNRTAQRDAARATIAQLRAQIAEIEKRNVPTPTRTFRLVMAKVLKLHEAGKHDQVNMVALYLGLHTGLGGLSPLVLPSNVELLAVFNLWMDAILDGQQLIPDAPANRVVPPSPVASVGNEVIAHKSVNTP